MPTVMEAMLASSPDVIDPGTWLHGAACSVFEGARVASDVQGAGHHAQHKPWTVWPLEAVVDGSDLAVLRLTWLDDAQAVPNGLLESPPDEIRLGRSFLPVIGWRDRHVPYEQLADARPVRRIRLDLQTPTFFSRNGRDFPLPDPVLVVQSLARRWGQNAPANLHWDDDTTRELSSTVRVEDFELEGLRVEGAGGRHRLGAVGYLEIGVDGRASQQAQRQLGALAAAAEYLGVGKDTTRGFGVVVGTSP